MNGSALRALLRGFAIAIAVAALIDPAMTSERGVKPDIALVSANAADRALSVAVAGVLRESFTVIDTPFTAAAATVVVGQHAPVNVSGLAAPIFAVTPDTVGLRINIDRLLTPPRAPLGSRLPVIATLAVHGAKGKTVEAHLVVNDVATDFVSRNVATNDEHIELPLSFVPTATGVVVLRVTANIQGSSAFVAASGVVDVIHRQWAVLFFDARPSWMSTFVRRSVERDARFIVTSRTVTSRGVSTDAGHPPAGFDDLMVDELYDAIVVGAPESLSDRDIDGLNSFLRRRGGSVVMLFDENKTGRYDRLVDFGRWTRQTNSQPAVIAGPDTDSIAMRATEWMWPSRLPVLARVLAYNESASRDSTGRHPMVWQASVGAGRLIVSTALDAWKFRDVAQSGFEKFWQQTVGEAANAAPGAIELLMPATAVEPGELAGITVTARNASLAEQRINQPVHASAGATLSTPTGNQRIRLWPIGAVGTFRGEFRAPQTVGTYRVRVTADGAITEGALTVKSAPIETANPAEPDLLAAWAFATSGQLVRGTEIAALPARLAALLHPATRRVSWHPMRSAWWLAPFALLLSGEWWLRRRRGLA